MRSLVSQVCSHPKTWQWNVGNPVCFRALTPFTTLTAMDSESLNHQRDSLDLEIFSLQLQLCRRLSKRNQLAPISQLPNELLSRIFLFRRDAPRSRTGPKMPMSAWISSCLGVCTHWRNVAIATQELWSHAAPEELTTSTHFDPLTVCTRWVYWSESPMTQVLGSIPSLIKRSEKLRLHITDSEHNQTGGTRQLAAPTLATIYFRIGKGVSTTDVETFLRAGCPADSSANQDHPLESVVLDLFPTSYISPSNLTMLTLGAHHDQDSLFPSNQSSSPVELPALKTIQLYGGSLRSALRIMQQIDSPCLANVACQITEFKAEQWLDIGGFGAACVRLYSRHPEPSFQHMDFLFSISFTRSTTFQISLGSSPKFIFSLEVESLPPEQQSHVAQTLLGGFPLNNLIRLNLDSAELRLLCCPFFRSISGLTVLTLFNNLEESDALQPHSDGNVPFPSLRKLTMGAGASYNQINNCRYLETLYARARAGNRLDRLVLEGRQVWPWEVSLFVENVEGKLGRQWPIEEWEDDDQDSLDGEESASSDEGPTSPYYGMWLLEEDVPLLSDSSSDSDWEE